MVKLLHNERARMAEKCLVYESSFAFIASANEIATNYSEPFSMHDLTSSIQQAMLDVSSEYREKNEWRLQVKSEHCFVASSALRQQPKLQSFVVGGSFESWFSYASVGVVVVVVAIFCALTLCWGAGSDYELRRGWKLWPANGIAGWDGLLPAGRFSIGRYEAFFPHLPDWTRKMHANSAVFVLFFLSFCCKKSILCGLKTFFLAIIRSESSREMIS